MKNLMDEESISKNQLDHFGLPKPDFYGLCDQVHFHARNHSCAESARYFSDECRVETGEGGGTQRADSYGGVHVDRSEECFTESRVVTGPDKALSDNARVSLCCNLEDSPSDRPVVQDSAYSRKKGGKDCNVPLPGQLEASNRYSLKPTNHGAEEPSRLSFDPRCGRHERQEMDFDNVLIRESRNRDREETSFFVDVQGNNASYLSRDEELAGREAMTVKSTMGGGGLMSNCQAQLEVDGGDDLVTHAEGKVGRRTRVFAVKKPAAVCDPPLEAGIMEDADLGHRCVPTAIPAQPGVSESVAGIHVGRRPNQCTSNSAAEPDCAPTGGLKHDFGQEVNGCGYSGPRAPSDSPVVKGESCEFFGGMQEEKRKVRYFVQPNSPAETSSAVERSPEEVAGDDDLFDSMLRDCEVVEPLKEVALGEDAVQNKKPFSNFEELVSRRSHEASDYGDQAGIRSPIEQHVADFNQQGPKKQSPASACLVDKASVVSPDDDTKVRDLGDNGMEEDPLNLSAVSGSRQGFKASTNDSVPSRVVVGKDSGFDNQYVDTGVPQWSEERPATSDAGTRNAQGETAVGCPEIEEMQGPFEVGISSQVAEEELTGIVDKFAHILSEDGEREELGNDAPYTDATPGLVEKVSSQNGITGSEGKHGADMVQTLGARTTTAGTHSRQIPEDVIDLVDDDDDEDEEGDADGVGNDDDKDYGDYSSDCDNSASGSDDESDATSRKVSGAAQHMSRREGVGDDNNPSAVPLQPAEDSDDDCQVISQMPPRQKPAGFVAKRTFQSHLTGNEDTAREDSKTSSESGSDSDCEVLDASQTDIRRRWEEAALRRRMSSALKSEASNVGRGAASDMRSHASRSSHDRNASFSQPVAGEREQQSSKHHHGRAESVATSTDTDLGETGEKPSSGEGVQAGLGEIDPHRNKKEPLSSRGTGMDQTGTENAVPLEEAESIVELDEVVVGCPTSQTKIADAEAVVPALSEKSCERDIGDEVSQHTSQVPDSQVYQEACEQECGVAVESLAEGLVDREKLKETDEFRQANDEEWARRKIELERQSSEAQKLRKRKRAEADRRLEVESRQKQRVEEIRQFQQQEELNLGLKDKLRGKIRGQLEDLAKGCVDMATLLRRLGVQMDGGASPSSAQVNAAYKRALLRFHPDRAAVPVNGDPQNQVEAEETFKLMSRLKNSLPLVALPSRPAISGRYFNF